MAAILDFRGVSDTKESQNPIFQIYFLDAFHHVRYQKSASIINFFHIWTPIPGLNQWWPSPLTYTCVTRLQWVNDLKYITGNQQKIPTKLHVTGTKGVSANILQTTSSSQKTDASWIEFHCNLFSKVQLTTSQHWVKKWLVTCLVPRHYLNQWWSSSLMHIYITSPRCDNWAVIIYTWADSRFAPSQWETALCNGVCHWLGTSLESALNTIYTMSGKV